MTTPTYKGTSQPAANSGWLAGMGSWFDASAPAYSALAPVKPPVALTVPVVDGTCDADRITLVIPRSLIGSRQLIVSAAEDGELPPSDGEWITLVIPRSLIQSQQ